MINKESLPFKIAWISLLITGIGILAFGLITALWPGSNETTYLRATGVASIGMGLFGIMITLKAFRRNERWAWLTLWYYPIFWLIHFFGRLPPGQDRVHQVLFFVISLAGLVMSAREFFTSH